MILLFAHSIFCLGIWNARDGYSEETGNVASAFQSVRSGQSASSLYVRLIALTLEHVTPDPVQAVTWMKYFSSLLATVSLFLVLSCFSDRLRKGAILISCFVWIASSLNAPFSQTTSLSLFTLALMLFALYPLLGGSSVVRLICFFALGWCAASLRPEYHIPLALVAAVVAIRLLGHAVKWVQARFAVSWYWTAATAAMLLLATAAMLCIKPPSSLRHRLVAMDQYALLGLSQCYADFYSRTHPHETLSSMVEYQPLINRVFDKPTGFLDALRHNPREAARYFFRNASDNLFRNAPRAFLANYRERSHVTGSKWVRQLVQLIMICGAVAGSLLWHQAWRSRKQWSVPISAVSAVRHDMRRRIVLLSFLAAASGPATVLLVGTPRYFLPFAPLFYLGFGFCVHWLLQFAESCKQATRIADLRSTKPAQLEALVVVALAFLLCRPNFLLQRPNYMIDALRHIAPLVQRPPRIAAWWAQPAVVFAFEGHAEPISTWDGITQYDIQTGRIDILVIEWNLRSTKCWAEQRQFFEDFERQPERFGFTKITDVPTGGCGIYFRRNP